MALIRQWGLVCIECGEGIELGRLVSDVAARHLADEAGFELLHGEAASAGIPTLEAFLVSHAGHDLVVVDRDYVLGALEDLDPEDLPVRWTRTPSPIGQSEDQPSWLEGSGGRRVLKWIRGVRQEIPFRD